MTFEPFGNDLADGDAAHLVAHRKDSKADAGDDDLPVMPHKHDVAWVGSGAGDVLHGNILDECPNDH